MRLAKAAEDPYSLQERDPEAEAAARAAQAQAQQEQQEQQERAKARTPQGHSGSGLPPLAPVMLGMEEDADLSTWDMMEFEQRAPAAQSRPTQLQEELVSLSQRLKRIVAQTYDVADSIPGGEWSVRQQQQLIQLLDSQRQRQRCVRFLLLFVALTCSALLHLFFVVFVLRVPDPFSFSPILGPPVLPWDSVIWKRCSSKKLA